MNKLVIGIDMDNTINDFTNQFLVYATNLGYKIDVSKAKRIWGLEESIIGYSKEDQSAIMNSIMEIDDYWTTMKAIPYAIEYVNWLAVREDCYIVTSPWRNEDKFYDTKIQWVEEKLPLLKNKIIFSHDKWSLDLDVIIDDKPKTLEKCNDVGIITIGVDYPYNSNVDVEYRMKVWYNLPCYIKQIRHTLSYKNNL